MKRMKVRIVYAPYPGYEDARLYHVEVWRWYWPLWRHYATKHEITHARAVGYLLLHPDVEVLA